MNHFLSVPKIAEQIEAEEINSLPRLVITADNFYAHPCPGKPITLDKQDFELLALYLMATLKAKYS